MAQPNLLKLSQCFLVFARTLFLMSALLGLSAHSSLAQSSSSNKVARVGVLAFRGVDSAMAQWQPLANYLTETVAGWEFEIVPVTLVSAPEKIKSNNLSFLITNPGHYVTLAEEFGLSALATRERRTEVLGTGLMRYGTVIFALKDSGVSTLDDLKEKRLAAVSPDAFGGFQLAWREFINQDIDPFSDLETIRFLGFPQDAIVSAVLAGEVEAGVVRSGLLEGLDREGRINLSDFVVLQNNSQLEYPHMISGPLYPEWPFTALPGIDKKLRERAASALFQTQIPSTASRFSLKDIWSAPLSYEDVRQITSEYRHRDSSSQLSASFLETRYIFVYLSFAGAVFLLLIWMRMRPEYRNKLVDGYKVVPEIDLDAPEIVSIKMRFESLTKREREVLCMICEGQQSKKIAEYLGISPKTVEYHRANLLHKSEAGTTAHLVQLATRFGYDLGFSLGHSDR